MAGTVDRLFAGAGGTYMRLTRKEAMRIAADSISPSLEARGARLRITLRRFNDNEHATYWIG